VQSLEHPENLTISQANRMVAPYATTENLVQLSAEGQDSEDFSELFRSAQRKAEMSRFYSEDFVGRSIEPLFRTLWRMRNKADRLFWLETQQTDPLEAFQKRILEQAIKGEHVSIVKALLDLDGDLRRDMNSEIINCVGDYYLYKACTRRSSEMALALIRKGADLNLRDKRGRTLLRCACLEGSNDIVEALLSESSIDADAKDDRGETKPHHPLSIRSLENAAPSGGEYSNLHSFDRAASTHDWTKRAIPQPTLPYGFWEQQSSGCLRVQASVSAKKQMPSA